MPIQLKVDTGDLTALAARLTQVAPRIRAELRSLLGDSARLVQAEAMRRTPAGTFNTVKPSTGHLRQAFTTMVEVEGLSPFARVENPLPYASFIESGVRTDRRAKAGVVYRRLGPAQMLLQGAAAAQDAIKARGDQFVREIADLILGGPA